MRARDWLPAGADPQSPIPAGETERLDRLRAAVAAMRSEERRLTRMGLETAARRCLRDLRYWEFLLAIFSLPPEPRADGWTGGRRPQLRLVPRPGEAPR